jgi:hypothetical protein
MATRKKTTKATARSTSAKKKAARKKAQTDTKMSALEAAAKVLGQAKEPLNSKTLVEKMSARNYWTSPNGKTPHATLYAAILREIQKKGDDARFRKVERGRFELNR